VCGVSGVCECEREHGEHECERERERECECECHPLKTGPSEKHDFQTETRKILNIVAQSLYTEREVCIWWWRGRNGEEERGRARRESELECWRE
jgi:hypothetical protein